MSKPDPYDNPERNTAVLENLVGNFQLIHAIPFLQSLTFDQVTEYWWYAQRLKADALDKQARRVRQ